MLPGSLGCVWVGLWEGRGRGLGGWAQWTLLAQATAPWNLIVTKGRGVRVLGTGVGIERGGYQVLDRCKDECN